MLPSPGEAPGDPKVAGLHHPRPRGPGHHLPVPVLGLRPPPDGGHPRQQAGQQTTTGCPRGTSDPALPAEADDGGVQGGGREAGDLPRAPSHAPATPPAPAGDTRVRLIHTQVPTLRGGTGVTVHRVPEAVRGSSRHHARPHGLRVRAAEVL